MEKYRFNFQNYPELKKLYQKYREMRLGVVKISMKETNKTGQKLRQSISEKKEFSRTILAKSVYDIFSKIQPLLHNVDDDTYVEWANHFNGDFETFNEDLRDDLVGLIDGNFIYELPLQYYIK